jgi:hypothetical protein
MKNAVFWDVAPCRSCVNRRLGGTYRLYLQGRKFRARETSVSRWLQDWIKSKNTPSGRIYRWVVSSERNTMSDLRFSRRWRSRHSSYISEYGILLSHRRENLKSDIVFLYGGTTYRHIRRLEVFFDLTQSAATCSRWFLARRIFYPEDGSDTFLRNVGSHKMYTAPHPRRRHSSSSSIAYCNTKVGVV